MRTYRQRFKTLTSILDRFEGKAIKRVLVQSALDSLTDATYKQDQSTFMQSLCLALLCTVGEYLSTNNSIRNRELHRLCVMAVDKL